MSLHSAERVVHACELCGEEIIHDVVRIDEGRLYHLSCFRRHVPETERGMYECPKCKTTGCSWDWAGQNWRACGLCTGSGYLSVPGGACGN